MAKVQELSTLNQVGNYTAVSNDMMKKYAGKIGIGPIVTWSLIYNRYQSSQGKASFWDEEQEDYYAIFTVKELVSYLGVSATTINDFLNKLVDEDLLIKTKPKKGFNKANRFFPKLTLQFSKAVNHKSGMNEPFPATKKSLRANITDKQKFNVSVIKNPVLNHLNLNYSLDPYSSYSFNTRHSVIKNTNSTVQDTKILQEQATHCNFKKIQDKNDLETAIHDLKSIGIPDSTVSVLLAFSHNRADELKDYRRLLLEAKSDVRSKAMQQGIDYRAFSNEDNKLVQENILWAIRRTFSYTRKACKTKQHAKNYFRSAMKSFYETAVDAYSQGKTELVI